MEVRTDEVDGLLKKLQGLGLATYRAILLRIGARVGLKVEEIVSVYPEQKERHRKPLYTRTHPDGSTYLSVFKSAKQQGYVASLFADGKIPYKRTGLLGRSFNSQASVQGNDVVVKVGTSVVYAPYVLDEDEQASIHRDYWTPVQEDLVQHAAEIVQFTQEQITDATNAYFLP